MPTAPARCGRGPVGSGRPMQNCGDRLRPAVGGNDCVAPVLKRHAGRPSAPQQDPRQPRLHLGGRDVRGSGYACTAAGFFRRRASRSLARWARPPAPAPRVWSPLSLRASGCAVTIARPRAPACARRLDCLCRARCDTDVGLRPLRWCKPLVLQRASGNFFMATHKRAIFALVRVMLLSALADLCGKRAGRRRC
jgi:hypothetical protein